MTSRHAEAGKTGFTDAPEVRTILAPLEGLDESPNLVRFRGLRVTDGRRLLEVLPDWQRGDRQNFSPTFEEFVALGDRYPSLVLDGYRATSERSDERITIEGVRCTGLAWGEAAALREWCEGADELDVVPEGGAWTVTGADAGFLASGAAAALRVVRA